MKGRQMLFILYTLMMLLSGSMNIKAQNHCDIRLQEQESQPKGKICYNVELRSSDLKEVDLAGQNYRLYYDASLLELDEERSHSLLETDNYTKLMFSKPVHNMEANGVGPLNYSNNLGFVNYGIDLIDTKQKGVLLKATGEWLTTSQLCFSIKKEEEVLTRGGIHWARESLTKSYATAFVEVTELVEPDVLAPLLVNEYFDKEVITSVDEEKLQNIKLYPNPIAEYLILDAAISTPFQVEIWGVNGKRVMLKEMEGGQKSYRLDLSALESGSYSLRAYGEGLEYHHIIEKIRL